MTMLRIVVGYGVSAEITGCARLDMILSKMTFKTPRARTERPTFEQAKAIIEMAHELGAPSIALGQALQFDGVFRQSNVIGLWRPLAPGEEPGGRQTLNGKVWEDGLRWDHLDDDMVLRFTTTKREFAVEIDLSLYPLTKAELERVPPERRIGPMVIDERSGLPYADKGYAKRWRKIATAASVPTTVWNRDSRSGGITEGRNAGADFEDLAKQAAHADPRFTAKVYSRDNLEAARRVARLRAERRNAG
jgi:hypothetical protein